MMNATEKNIEVSLKEAGVLPHLVESRVEHRGRLAMLYPDASVLDDGEDELIRFLAGYRCKPSSEVRLALEYYTAEYGLGYFLPPTLQFLGNLLRTSIKIFAKGSWWAIFVTKIFDSKGELDLNLFTLVRAESGIYGSFLRIIPLSASVAEEIKSGKKSAFQATICDCEGESRLTLALKEYFNAGDTGKVALNPREANEANPGAWFLFQNSLRIEQERKAQIEQVYEQIRNTLNRNLWIHASLLECFFQKRARFLGTSEFVLRPGFRLNAKGYARIVPVYQTSNYITFIFQVQDPFAQDRNLETYWIMFFCERDYVLLPIVDASLLAQPEDSKEYLKRVLRALQKYDQNFKTFTFRKVKFIYSSKIELNNFAQMHQTNYLKITDRCMLEGDISVAGNWIVLNSAGRIYDPERRNYTRKLKPGSYVIISGGEKLMNDYF